MNFNWQTEDDSQWEQERVSPQPAGRPKYTRPLIWLASLVFVAAAGLLIWWQVDQRLDEVSAGLEAEVRASHQLLRQVANEGDSELFVSMLSGRDPAWTEVQLELLNRNLLFGNEATLLGLLPEPMGEPTGTVTLSANLNEAVMVVEQQYRPDNFPDASPITLQHLSIYRQGGQRWLLSPPEDEFWGNWATSAGQHLTLVYPTRDEHFALQLQQYLNEKLELLCQTQLVESCRPAELIRVRLEKEASSLLPLTAPVNMLRPEREIVLPAPSLVGIPVDPAGEDLLLRHYAALILQSAVVQLTDWQCCRKGAFEQLLLEQLLVELEVMPRPEPALLYRELINFSPFNLDSLERLWLTGTLVSLDTTEAKTARAFVDFMQNRSGLTAGELLSRLNQASRLNDWVATISDLPTQMDQLTRAWQEYVYLLSQASLQNYPPLPDQDLLALCMDSSGNNRFYRYNMNENRAVILQEVGESSFYVVTLPNDNGFITVTVGEDSTNVSSLYQDGQIIILSDEERFFYPLPISTPPGRNLVLGGILNQTSGLEAFAFVDGDHCDPAGCDYQLLDGLPTWSPNSLQYLLLIFGEGPLISWPTADGSQAIGQGFGTFWFDNESYGYFSFDDVTAPDIERKLVVASVSDHIPRPLLTSNDLQPFLPADDDSSYLHFVSAIMNPLDPQTLLLLVSATTNLERSYLFALRRLDNSQAWSDLTAQSLQIEQLQSWPFQIVDYSPFPLLTTHGQWLFFLLNRMDDGNGYLVAYDLQSQQTVLQTATNLSFGFDIGIDWSADGQWFVRPGEGFLDLVMLAPPGGDPTPYHQLIFHDLGHCSTALWINPE